MTPTHPGPESIAVDQAVFAYANGHQLIAATTKFDRETLTALIRLTDGTGAEAFDSFDGYLSGFPLPDGRYALTRTYRAESSARPGAVRTHAWIFHRRDLTGFATMWELYRCTRADVGDSDLIRLHVPAFDNFSEPIVIPQEWAPVISAFASDDDSSVGISAKTSDQFEQSVIALWSWMWPSLRANFSFCLGSMGSRNLRPGSMFDIVAIPRARASAKRTGKLVVDPHSSSPAGRAIAEDMTAGGSPFRSYVAYCGAESARRSTMSFVANVWLVATRSDIDRDARQIAVAETVCSRFPEPAEMRRLKSSLLSISSRLPVDWNPGTTLELLAERSVGSAVLSSDVAISELLKAVDSDPIHLLELAARSDDTSTSASDAKRIVERESVAAVLPTTLEEHALSALRPSDISGVVEVNAAAASRLLLSVPERDHAVWARAYWSMADESQDALANAYVGVVRVGGRTVPDAKKSSKTAGWLAYYAPNVAAGLNWIETCHPTKTLRRSALADLLRIIATHQSGEARWTGTISGETLVAVASDLVRQGAEPVLSGSLTAIEPDAGLRAGIDLAAWGRLHGALLSPIGAAHLLRYARNSFEPNPEGLEMACHAYAVAWQALASSNSDCWEALGDYPARPDPDAGWDRPMRLAISFAESVRLWSRGRETDARGASLEFTARFSESAARQLGSALKGRPAPPRRPVSETAGRPSRLDQFRNTVADIKSVFW